MLHLLLEGVSLVHSHSFESDRFRVDCSGITDSNSKVVATVNKGVWSAAGDFPTRWHCGGPVDVHFEFSNGREIEKRGTYPRVSMFGNIFRAGEEFLATLDDGFWRCWTTQAALTAIILAERQ